MESEKKHIVPNDVLLSEVRKMIAEGHPVNLMVKGMSMLPFIVGGRDGVRLVKPTALKVRDIVLAEIYEGHYVLHRIKRIERNQITLMGDGNLRGVEHCRLQDVAGKVEMIIRKGKEVNPASGSEQCKVMLWDYLTPVRRWLLAFYKRFLLKH